MNRVLRSRPVDPHSLAPLGYEHNSYSAEHLSTSQVFCDLNQSRSLQSLSFTNQQSDLCYTIHSTPVTTTETQAHSFINHYHFLLTVVGVFFLIYFYQLEANYFTVLQWVLSYIDMNQPWSSPSQSPLPPHSTRFLWVFPVHQAGALVSCFPPGLMICFTIDNIHAVLQK